MDCLSIGLVTFEWAASSPDYNWHRSRRFVVWIVLRRDTSVGPNRSLVPRYSTGWSPIGDGLAWYSPMRADEAPIGDNPVLIDLWFVIGGLVMDWRISRGLAGWSEIGNIHILLCKCSSRIGLGIHCPKLSGLAIDWCQRWAALDWQQIGIGLAGLTLDCHWIGNWLKPDWQRIDRLDRHSIGARFAFAWCDEAGQLHLVWIDIILV